MPCEICGSRRGTQASKDMVRKRKCVVCGTEFSQHGPGRPRLTCSKECAQKRHNWTERQITALDKVDG